MRVVVPLVVVLGLGSCVGVTTSGLGVVEPQVGRYTLERFAAYVEVGSLRPTFRWVALLPSDLGEEPDLEERLQDVTYELCIWEETAEGSVRVLRRDGLVGTEYRAEADLTPDARHLWSVRAWFRLDGKRRATNWALAGDPQVREAMPNLSCLRFRTPPR